MNVIFEKFEPNPEHSFYVNDLTIDHFLSPLHYHPEIEITYMIQGSGLRFAGESVQTYYPGEIVIIGENIPHAFISGQEHYREKDPTTSRSIYLLFQKDMFGKSFLEMPENSFLPLLFSEATRCIKVRDDKDKKFFKLITGIASQKGFPRLGLLLQLLYEIFISEEKEYLNVPDLSYKSNLKDVERINKVYEYVFANYQKDIRLETVAEITYLVPQSFCRYFKQHTNKTFSRFLSEIRISQACKKLLESRKSVKDIAYEVGYNHFSTFNKQFRKIMGTTALQYRKLHKRN
jgi:AraC-like DNA-binding protein